MDFLNKIFSGYLRDIDTYFIIDFVVNVVVTAALAMLIAVFYVRFGTAVSNRQRFAANFIPMALTTMLTILIVKSSLALSLGLVGALSIVRFRAAIKDPEEIIYLFLIISLGLATGANQPIMAVLGVLATLGAIWIYKKATQKAAFRYDDRVYINITTNLQSLTQIHQTIAPIMAQLELKRMDTLPHGGLDLSYTCQCTDIAQLEQAKNALLQLSPSMTISMISQPDLVI